MRKLKHSVTYRLLVMFILIALIPVAVSAFAVTRLVFSQIEQRIVERTKKTLTITEKILFTYTDKVSQDVFFVSGIDEIRASILKNDMSSLQSTTGKIARHLVTPLVEVFDKTGSVIARGEPSLKSFIAKVHTKNDNYFVKRALDYARPSSVSFLNNVLMFRASAPVVSRKSEVLGAVLVSSPMDENFIDYVKRVTGSDIMIFSGDKLVTTSLEDRGQQLKEYPNIDIVKKVLDFGIKEYSSENIHGQPYSVGYSPIKDSEGKILGVIAVALLKSHIIGMQTSSRNFILFFAFGSFLIAVLLGLIMSRSITSPISKLLKGVGSISKGHLSTEIKIKGKDEFSELANAFNQMTLDLKVSRDKLQAYSQNLEDKVEETQAQLVQSAKMAAIGQLAAGVAHEINNPMGYVICNLEVLKKYLDKMLVVFEEFNTSFDTLGLDSQSDMRVSIDKTKKDQDLDFICKDVFDILKESLEGASRVKTIVSSLKSFAHPTEEEFKFASINEEIEKSISIVWNELKYKCKIVRDFSTLPLIGCNAGQLVQVFVNLLINAGQAMEKEGTITIKTSYSESSIIIEVEDTGSGIDQENLNKVFEPFFTTKEPGSGTGLGLSVVYNIIKNHDGTMNVTSTEGVGTTFTVILPMNELEQEKEQKD